MWIFHFIILAGSFNSCWILQAVVLDPGLEGDLVDDIQKYLEDLINAGLRQRLISLIKVFHTLYICHQFLALKCLSTLWQM